MKRPDFRADARTIFDAGVGAVDPHRLVRLHLESREPFPERSILVVGGGKAAVPMARAVEELLGDRVAGGVVVTKRGHGGPLERIEVVEGRHPVPDEACAEGARRILAAIEAADGNDRVLVLLSGGASALLTLPRGGIDLDEFARLTFRLLGSGAPIEAVNAVRRHLTVLGGGGLAAAAFPRGVTTLILSDVHGNPIESIASGPTAPDPTTFSDALDVLQKFNLFAAAGPEITDVLGRGVVGREPDTRKAGDPVFERVENVIVGDNGAAIEGARARAEDLGYEARVVTRALRGEAAAAGRALAWAGREAAREPGERPVCILAGGETTVRLDEQSGLGGRSQELALAASLAIEGENGLVLLAGGTDGTDGPTDAAGAVIDGSTARAARSGGLDPEDALRRHNSYGFFQEAGGHLVTGPTRTNVMDLVVVLAERSR